MLEIKKSPIGDKSVKIIIGKSKNTFNYIYCPDMDNKPKIFFETNWLCRKLLGRGSREAHAKNRLRAVVQSIDLRK